MRGPCDIAAFLAGADRRRRRVHPDLRRTETEQNETEDGSAEKRRTDVDHRDLLRAPPRYRTRLEIDIREIPRLARPGPRLNLAITLDRAGQQDEALAAYTAALEVWPRHIGAIQGLASFSIRARQEAVTLRCR